MPACKPASSLNYQHIIWDWNGTLLDDVDYCIGIMNTILRERSLPELDRHRYHSIFDFPVQLYYSRLGFDPAIDTFHDLSVKFITGYDANRWNCALNPFATRLLESTGQSGATQSILSAYRDETLKEIVAHFNLTKHFSALAGLDNIYAHSKTDLGRRQMLELGIPKENVVLIGDTLHDLEVARELGVDCVLVATGHHPAARLRQHHDRVVERLDQLAQIPRLGFLS